MKSFQIDCGSCRTRLAIPLSEAGIQTQCPSCNSQTQIEVFPALLQEAAAGKRGEALLMDDQSSCFYHPANKAALLCENCGRFLCSLCDIEWDGRHLCSSCIDSGVQKGKLESLQSQSTYWDNIALALAVIPMLIFYLTLITAPVTLYFAIRHWNTPMSALPRSKLRLIVPILLAGLQVTGWGVGAVLILGKILS